MRYDKILKIRIDERLLKILRHNLSKRKVILAVPVLVAAESFALVGENRGYSLLRCTGFSLR